jgi:TonB-linked SusC/RagA family outer membrane protein
VLLLLLFCLFSLSLFAQKIITGKIAGDSSVLAGVTVAVKNGVTTTTTNAAGQFSIRALNNETLVFSFVGYTTEEVKIAGRSEINLKMTRSNNQLDQVIIVGYGRQKLPTVTGSVSVVDGKSLVQTPVANLSNMLIGLSPGVTGLQNSGEPGQNATSIHIRGIATLNGSNPLVVIDGIQQPAENPFQMFDAIDANDVDNISILKDASATAVYGIRGANGVIIVTTKRGKLGRPVLSFSTSEAFNKATSTMPLTDSYDFAVARNQSIQHFQAAGNSGYNNLLFSNDELWKFQHNRDYTPAEISAMSKLTAAQQAALNNSPALYYGSHDYYHDLFSGTGMQRQANVNVSGGTPNLKYANSLGYFDQSSILNSAYTNFGGANVGSRYTRYTFRNNLDVNVIKNFELSVNVSGQFIRNKVANPMNDVGGNVAPSDLASRYRGMMLSIFQGGTPFISPGVVNGRMVIHSIGDPLSATNPIGGPRGGDAGQPSQSWAPLDLAGKGYGLAYGTNLSTQAILKHTMNYITTGLSSHFTVGYDDNYQKGYNITKSIPTYLAYRDQTNPVNIDFIDNPPSTDYSFTDYQSESAYRKLYFETGIDYNRSFGSHNVTGLILGNAQKYIANNLAYNTPSGLMGLVGRVTYNFKERYLAEGTMGYNGTENFAPGHRFGFFPAGGLGWIISRESFLRNSKVITYAKVRGSYGESGNDQIGNPPQRYLYLPNTWNLGDGNNSYFFGNTNGATTNPQINGATEASIGNPAVTWERAKKMNLQLDLNFLGNRLTFSGAYFTEKRTDILVVPGIVPATFGVAGVPVSNSGIVTNKGIELELGWTDKIGRDVTYYAKGSFSYARNKINYMAEAPFPYPWMDQTGFSIGQPKGLVATGFFNTPEQLANRPYNIFGNLADLGDLKYKDVNGDGMIDNKDMVPIGYPSVPLISYNWRVGFSYKRFDISALFVGTSKGSYNTLSTVYANGDLIQAANEGRWTQEKYAQGQKITYPAFNGVPGAGVGPSSEATAQLSTFWLRSTDFVRLKNLALTYTLSNAGILQRTGIKGISLTLTGNNLITWTKLPKGIDPESTTVSAPYLYPLIKTYNFGLNVTF